MSNCFLVADEVGLGKTIIAQHVAKGVFENENGLRMVYVASNNRIARQNETDFLRSNIKYPKAFQKATINRVLGAFYGEKNIQSEKKQLCEQKIIKDCDRISMYHQGTPRNSNWEVMILSPKTSFYCEEGSVYNGEQDENDYLRKKASLISKKIAELNGKSVNSIINENTDESRMVFSFWYEYNLLNSSIPGEEYVKSIIAALELGEIKVDNREFQFIRRVVSNVAFLSYNPNLIVLDEFQRFRKVLNSNATNHYSVKHLLDFMRCYYSRVGNNESVVTDEKLQLPKILLLSATPYIYDMSSIILEEEKDESVNGEDPFSSFGDLKRCIEELGGCTNDIESFMSRTERNMFIENSSDLFEIIHSESDLKSHLEYLQSVYKACPRKNIKQGDEEKDIDATDVVDSIIEHTPHFWIGDIQRGYKGKMGTKIIFKKERELKNPIMHAKFQTVIKYVFPKNIENHLWLPPASKYNTEIRKCLIFSKYKMTDRVIPIVINKNFREKLDRYSISNETVDTECLKNKLKELLGIQEEKIIGWLVVYLSTDIAKKVINKVKNGYDIDKIIAYCKCYNLKEVIEEYMYCERMQKHGSVFDYGLEEVFACEYIEEDLSPKNQKDDVTKKQTQFNSPFYPFVMTVTETAQEGIDLHYYCDQIIHWSIPASASAFIQREGRIDRPNSLVIRKRIQQWTQENHIIGYDERKGIIGKKIQKDGDKKAKDAGIFPDWYIPICDDPSPRIRRVLCGTFLSGEMEKDDKMLYASNNYNQFLDEESKIGLCPILKELKPAY